MKLPDFSDKGSLQEIRKKMEISLIDKYSQHNWETTTLAALEGASGVLITDISKVIQNEEFFVDGIRVLLYIKSQSFSEYKYHIIHCKTLKDMEIRGRIERYVASRRSDGFFLVDKEMSFFDKENYRYEKRIEYDREISMNVCKNCLRAMLKKYPYDSPLWIYEFFNLEDFFSKHGTEHVITPKYDDKTQPKNEYPHNWNEISLKMRENVGWQCQNPNCMLADCSDKKDFLHVHHKNGLKFDNRRANLVVLCKYCHSKQPNHQHMKLF